MEQLLQPAIDLFARYPLLGMTVAGTAIFGFMCVAALVLVLAERKIAGDFQTRPGPNRIGPYGLLQTVLDALKLLRKENIQPAAVERTVWYAAPIIVFVAAFVALLPIPWDRVVYVKDLDIGILFVFAIGSWGVIGILMAGWGSNNRYSLLGGLRAAAQIISYEAPMIIAALGPVMLAGTLSLRGIVEAQSNVWYIVLQPVAFLVYLITAIAETNRAPFDMPEAEAELTGGFHTEYSGMKFAMFFLAEYANMVLVCAVATTLFLGGWQGPWLPGIVWFFLKMGFLVFLFIWFRWTFPRVRVDQMMVFGWKVLVPLAFVNLLATGLLIVTGVL